MAFVGDLRAQPVHLVVAARDAHQLRAENLRADNFCRLKIGRNKDHRFESIARGLGRHRIRQIAGGRAGNSIEAKIARLRQSHRDHAVFEAQGGQTHGVILQIEVLRPKLLLTVLARIAVA